MKCKAALLYDPWLLPHSNDILEGKISIKLPTLIVNSYNCYDIIE